MSVAHTPAVPVNETARRILDRADVPDEHKQRLFGLVEHAQRLAADAALEDKLQAEYGREAVALILDCKQFLRLHRAGDATGRVAMLLPDGDKQALRDAGFTLHEPEGMVFKMFGWVAVDPMDGPPEALTAALDAAWAKAQV